MAADESVTPNVNDITVVEGGPLVESERLGEILGWELKPQGLCRDDTCVLVPDPSAIRSGDRIDLTAVGELLDRPTAHDPESGLVAIGAPRDQRRGALHDLRAPDFTLPDVDGTPHALSDHRSKKRLLVAFSSW